VRLDGKEFEERREEPGLELGRCVMELVRPKRKMCRENLLSLSISSVEGTPGVWGPFEFASLTSVQHRMSAKTVTQRKNLMGLPSLGSSNGPPLVVALERMSRRADSDADLATAKVGVINKIIGNLPTLPF